jgi:hypothetical protein
MMAYQKSADLLANVLVETGFERISSCIFRKREVVSC